MVEQHSLSQKASGGSSFETGVECGSGSNDVGKSNDSTNAHNPFALNKYQRCTDVWRTVQGCWNIVEYDNEGLDGDTTPDGQENPKPF